MTTAAARPLDFIVIGAQKAGTTSLWHYLRGHPRIRLPDGKEAPFFIRPDALDPDAYRRFVDLYFGDAPATASIGTVTPHYMMGHGETGPEAIAARIARVLPDVAVVAVLREPIERAISHYRMSVRRGIETRPFEQAARELLRPERLEEARRRPDEVNSYLSQGEYGRILTAYRSHFPPRQMHALLSADLQQRPGEALDRLLTFLGLEPGHRPHDLGVRHHRGGLRPRIDDTARQDLLAFLDRHVWPHCSDRERDAFNFFFETWNVIPDDERPAVGHELEAELRAHFARDAALLRTLGVEVPWARDAHAG